jgi:hypothetical protein
MRDILVQMRNLGFVTRQLFNLPPFIKGADFILFIVRLFFPANFYAFMCARPFALIFCPCEEYILPLSTDHLLT